MLRPVHWRRHRIGPKRLEIHSNQSLASVFHHEVVRHTEVDSTMIRFGQSSTPTKK